MEGDRSWMYRRHDELGYWVDNYTQGIEVFLNFAFAQTNVRFIAMNKILCPCNKCWNRNWYRCNKVRSHLLRFGFMEGYYVWRAHGEGLEETSHRRRRRRCIKVGESSHAIPTQGDDSYNVDQLTDMFHDAMRPNFFNENNGPQTANYASDCGAQSIFEDVPCTEAREFHDLLQAAVTPLFGGCDDVVTVLKWVCEFLNAKTLFNMSVTNWDYVIQKSLMAFKKEDRDKLTHDYYNAKKMLKRLGLGYEKYDVCINNYFLYYDEFESHSYQECPIYGQPQFKQSCSGKNISRKCLWYLPIIPRLQRLFMCRKIVEHMTWHLNCHDENENIFHPACGEAWKHFDSVHSEFTNEHRNVRLGLCTDGFTPYGQSAAPYSCWPIFTSVYNLPPSMCMKQGFVFLTLIIQGLQNPEKNIDVMLRPLIDDLKRLWYSGIKTYDSFRRHYFVMQDALMWTISDFSGYAMLSGWSTHGKLACPYCMQNSKAFWLENGRKTSFFDCHRQFLPPNHPFRMNKNDFIKGHIEVDFLSKRASGDEMCARTHCLPDIEFGKPLQNHVIQGLVFIIIGPRRAFFRNYRIGTQI